MEYSNFKLHILDQIKEHAEDGDSIRTQTIIKNNNSIYDALIVMKKK